MRVESIMMNRRMCFRLSLILLNVWKGVPCNIIKRFFQQMFIFVLEL